MPNLSTIEGWSFAVTDPKGEIYRTMRKPLEAKGLRVRTFNLVDLRQSNRFNPLAYINDTEPETGVAQLTETIMANTSGKESRGDGFWERRARSAHRAHRLRLGDDDGGKRPDALAVRG